MSSFFVRVGLLSLLSGEPARGGSDDHLTQLRRRVPASHDGHPSACGGTA